VDAEHLNGEKCFGRIGRLKFRDQLSSRDDALFYSFVLEPCLHRQHLPDNPFAAALRGGSSDLAEFLYEFRTLVGTSHLDDRSPDRSTLSVVFRFVHRFLSPWRTAATLTLPGCPVALCSWKSRFSAADFHYCLTTVQA
jgi:hypothetical protein